uniref:EGF-like domain-containing protein n=1 Tax=Panagrellus redivivus TaxID=6233 RepID=A0A7E4W143_PANRE
MNCFVFITVVIFASLHQVSTTLYTFPLRTCHATSCSSNKVCIHNSNGRFCVCPLGKVGSECEFDDPCLNRGYCGDGYCISSDMGVPECICKPGYQGQYCTEDINECKHNPCPSNQRCYNTIGSFLCIRRRSHMVHPHPRNGTNYSQTFFFSVGLMCLFLCIIISLLTVCAKLNLVRSSRINDKVTPQVVTIA